MTSRINIITLLLTSLLIMSCKSKNEVNTSFEKMNVENEEIRFHQFIEFCNLNLIKGEHERNAVKCAFIGDYENSINQATLDASYPREPFTIEDKKQFPPMHELDSIMKNSSELSDEWRTARIMKGLWESQKPLEEYYKDSERVGAVSFIANSSKDFHFTLINEAHYCSQHREFTSELLKPLWDLGYRYLALETASAVDKELNYRRYPTENTGFYTKDSNFANLVRNALKIGYNIVPYETDKGYHGSDRDLDQANNILKRTWELDKLGKVLVHAGYSHIDEDGIQNYRSMGYYLKKNLGQDILTIDQVNMTHLKDNSKLNNYYSYVLERNWLTEPLVLTNSSNESILQPLKIGSVDIQVYHPPTKFINQRPDWLIDGRISIELPKEISKHLGSWLRLFKENEIEGALPVDQFVIHEDSVIVLEDKGDYILKVINCEGKIIDMYEMKVYS